MLQLHQLVRHTQASSLASVVYTSIIMCKSCTSYRVFEFGLAYSPSSNFNCLQLQDQLRHWHVPYRAYMQLEPPFCGLGTRLIYSSEQGSQMVWQNNVKWCGRVHSSRGSWCSHLESQSSKHSDKSGVLSTCSCNYWWWMPTSAAPYSLDGLGCQSHLDFLSALRVPVCSCTAQVILELPFAVWNTEWKWLHQDCEWFV